jgi:surfeit locus 1 family protein
MVTGTFRHDQEMLIGPRMRDGEIGYEVITPLERTDNGHLILVSRGWIPSAKKEQSSRDNSTGEALPKGKVQVLGLLREPIKKNMFTPDNKPGRGAWYFTDIKEMAAWVGADEVWVEEMMDPELFEIFRRTEKGIPMGRPGKVQLNNRHVEYIVTW